jgi:hypothetical protein
MWDLSGCACGFGRRASRQWWASEFFVVGVVGVSEAMESSPKPKVQGFLVAAGRAPPFFKKRTA